MGKVMEINEAEFNKWFADYLIAHPPTPLIKSIAQVQMHLFGHSCWIADVDGCAYLSMYVIQRKQRPANEHRRI